MIDFEKILVIAVGSLVLANFFMALALTIDWHRFRHYWTVRIEQGATDEERRALVYVGRFVWAWLLALVAWKGW
jgi:hypothetical protein